MQVLKPIFIHETIKTPLKCLNESATTPEDKYVLTGPCAWFDEINDNGRIYKKEDYITKIERLQEEIELGLHGEIEHTDDSEPSMIDSSHCIKKLWYDEENNCIMITIQLLNTEKGKILMAMVDADMPIYISSRAAGFIDENTSEVSLDEIYTYDVVRRPGFKNAKLDRINESKIKNNNVSEKSDICIYYNESKEINNQKDNNMSDFVTKGELKLFNDNMLKSIDNLKLLIKESKTIGGGKTDFAKKSVTINERQNQKINEEIEQKFTDITDYLDVVANSVNDKITELDGNHPMVQFADMIAQRTNANSEYLQILGDKLNGIIAFIKDQITNPFGVTDDKVVALDTTVSALSEYAEMIGKKVNLQEKRIIRTSALSEKLKADNKFFNESIDKIYIQNKRRINESVGDTIKIGDTIEFKHSLSLKPLKGKITSDKDNTFLVDCGRNGDFTINKDDKSIKLSSKGNLDESTLEKIDRTISNKILSTIKEVGGKLSSDTNKTLEFTKKLEELEIVNQSSVKVIISSYTDDEIASKVLDSLSKDGYDFRINESKRKRQFAKGELTKNIDRLLESVKRKETTNNQSITAIKYPFLNLADDKTKAIFENLSDPKKQKVSQVISEQKVIKKSEIADVVQQINDERGFISILSAMPKNLRPLWENCGNDTRQRITRLSQLKTLRNEDEMIDFWNNVDFGVIRRQKVDESMKIGDKGFTLVDELGYGQADIDRMMAH